MPEQTPKPKITQEVPPTIIKVKTKEGKETTFDFEQIRQFWIDFYRNHNLTEMAEELEKTKINLTEGQTKRIQELAETENFNHFLVLPSPETQQRLLLQIKQQTEKPIPGLPDNEQYSDQGTWLSGTVQPNFPDSIKTLNRPTKPYLVFTKDEQEVDQKTLDQTPDQLRQTFNQKNLQGLTLAEYLIFQRNYTTQNKKHPETKKWTWLLDSEIPPASPAGGQATDPARVLHSHWHPDYRRVRVPFSTSDHPYSHSGARSSAIFKI